MNMRLKDKRFWIWCVIVALMPVMMSVFAALLLIGVDPVYELFYYKNLEIFLIWEITYLLGGFLSYRKSQNNSWTRSVFICWGLTCPFLVILSFIWAGIRIHDGFTGLYYFMISCISWVLSILPLLLGIYFIKRFVELR
ncbi:hypothetical protein DMB45_08810 [Sanguibacteroides justesenii]|nr:hypothetical protein DMB45_08810 [Sanguibacteroides justesenii]